MPLLSVKDVTFSYVGRTVIRNLSFELETGETLSFIGPNGAGKTTILRLIGGLLVPDHGTITINHVEIGQLRRREVARRVALLSQIPLPSIDITVRELVSLGRYPHGKWLHSLSQRDHQAITEAMLICHVKQFSERTLSSLSAGEAQRAFLAMTLAQEAQLFLLDEPFAHLDLAHRESVFEVLAELSSTDRAIIIAAHDLLAASILSSRISLIGEGKLQAIGSPSDVLRKEPLERVFKTDLEITALGNGIAISPDFTHKITNYRAGEVPGQVV